MDNTAGLNINIDLLDNIIKKPNKNSFSNDKKERNVIVQYNFFCLNNTTICEKIKQIPEFISKYDVILEYNQIKIGDMNKRIIDQYDIIPRVNTTNNDKYVLLRYNNMDFISFNAFLFNLPTPKLFILYIIESYSYLLDSLYQLNQNGVVFLNLSAKNIIFDKNYKPLLRNFKSSLITENINSDYISHIIDSLDDYTCQPLEIHVIFHLIKNNETSLSYSSIEYICEFFVKNMKVLTLFSQQYANNYYNICVETLKKYINKPKLEIINGIISNLTTLDNYSLSLLYLHIIGNLIEVFSLKDNFISQITMLLTKNIHPDPLKRETLQNTIEQFGKIMNDNNDWSFVNKIKLNKIKDLYKILIS